MTTQPKPAPATGLALLRAPFPPHQISKLPKPTKAQTDAIRADYKAGIRCELCGAWHHPKVVHLDYVGHAALTDRLLDADPNYSWEPQARGPDGLPAFDQGGGLWIYLTVCGQTRPGYGNAERKQHDTTGGDRIKEVIGDALRNAAMRFGAALDLWHKGDLHIDDGGGPDNAVSQDGGHGPDGAGAEIYADDAIEHINEDQITWIIDMLEQHNIPPARLLKAAGVRTVSSLPAADYAKAQTWINNAIAEREAA